MGNASHDSTKGLDGLDELFMTVREAQDQALRLDDPRELARARARLLQAVDRAATTERSPAAVPGRRSLGWRFGLATLAAAACAFAVLIALPGDEPLEFEVDGVALDSYNARITSDEHARTLSFSDSTNIELSPGSSMFVDDLRQNGASVVLEHGEVSLDVHHEHDTSWQVSAGPYAVYVTGTEFNVAWEPGTEYFSVEVEEGSVRVEGPEGAIANLRAGDSLVRERGKATIEPETIELLLQPDSSSDSLAANMQNAAEPSDPEPAQAGASTESILDKTTKPGISKTKGPSWVSFFQDADYSTAWALLADRPGGIIGEGQQADADTLLDLADVARFTKHHDDAIKLLEQLRTRFPGTDAAGEAAFTLGRIEADRGAQAKAVVYFELYLDERPTGSLVDNALGRLMVAYQTLGRSDDANATAERYLARFPNGPHAGKAHEILGE
jgi:transmembrane sensor